ncbi:MBL fold metallo-hydrolase [Pseudonocardiaceae bacterium YIM PH 21723]|nr:MBL fold metallo-hydrolase [Pseudonocardiaceae bacterium YIM PH 21723]
MLVAGFPAGALQANCYLLATGPGAECVIVDPGQDSLGPLAETLIKHELTPAAVLLTHGHFDHVFDATPTCDKFGVAAYIHPADKHLLSDPLAGISRESAAFFGGKLELTEPADLVEITDGQELELAGMRISVIHTPGHTAGSVFYRVETDDTRLIFAGDTLFAGSIGRTDLPGGDHTVMLETLRTRVLPLADDTIVLPGHGPHTTIGQERATNPFLQDLDDLPAAPKTGL